MKLKNGNMRQIVTASFIGNFVEWFDYASYGYLATVIAVVFFPSADKTTGLIAAFTVFALSFLIRPLGGVFWGHFGDLIGRKKTLSISIITMSGATACIAFIPTYEQVGILAPILLLVLRLIQGFSASGEYVGAAIFLVEHAPNDQRGRYASIVPASTATGLLLGSLFIAALYTLLTTEQLHTWGWRIPFFLAAPFGLIGYYIRIRLEDSPKFKEMTDEFKKKNITRKISIIDLLSTKLKYISIGLGVTCLNAVGFYLLLSYMPTYFMTEIKLTEQHAFLISTLSLLIYIFMVFIMGMLSDRFGRKAMLSLASICFILFTIPLFLLLNKYHNNLLFLILIQCIFGLFLAMNDGTLSSFLCEIFPTSVRYSGFAFSFNCANALFGGTAPLIATQLIHTTGSSMAPAYFLVVAAGVSIYSMYFSQETAKQKLPS